MVLYIIGTLGMLGSGKTLLKTEKHGLLQSTLRMWRWACVCSFDFAYEGLTLRMWAVN